jgi:hypothetical protein
MRTLTLPEELITRVDFGKFWEAYIRGPLTKVMLLQAKRDLLDVGVQAMTVYAYFWHLSLTLVHESDDALAGTLEDILHELLNLDREDEEFLETAGIAQ